MTFSCPHYDIDKDKCWRLKTECVPGRPGCVMRSNSRFAVPAEQRIAEAQAESKRKKALSTVEGNQATRQALPAAKQPKGKATAKKASAKNKTPVKSPKQRKVRKAG